MNPFLIELTVKQRRQEMQEEAERQRLRRLYSEARASRPKGRLAIAFGNYLIRIGERIKIRYEQEMETSGKLCKGHPE